jgi:hypothetical protein
MPSKGLDGRQAHAERFRCLQKIQPDAEEGSCQGMTGGPHLIRMLQELHERDRKNL